MALTVGALLAAVALAVVLWPFLRRRGGAEPLAPTGAGPLSEAQRSREAIYEEIRTLQVEHALGEVDAREYEERLQAARLQAAALLRHQEVVEQRLAALDDALEAEIQRARRTLDGAGGGPRDS